MRRTDRLYALVEELRARSPRAVSRSTLAAQLEVTARTVERDVLALQQAGVPIWSQRGRGGGYVLDSRWTVPPLNLDATEVLAVVAALATAKSLPFAEAGRRAERKLLGSMVPDEAKRARQLATRLRAESVAPAVHRRVLRAVEQGVVERRVLEIAYADRGGQLTRRAVEPHELHVSADGTYLVAWCRLRDDERSFRLDRIASARVADDAVPDRETEPDDSPDEGELMTATPKRAWGPPRKADHRTGSNPAFARAVAEELPAVTAKTERGRARTVFSVNGVAFASVDDDETLELRPRDDDVETLLLNRVGRDDTREVIERAWRSHASKDQVAELNRRKKRRAARKPITAADVRRIALALPRANEGPIWGKDIGFRIGDEKRTRFARWGPPLGGRVSNLLPPDDEDTLVILRCPQRPALLASAALRYFTTPHYGDPDEPGSVIVRLCELRGKEELQELTELIEDAWAAAGGHAD